jgi:hypothetical protein
LGRGNFKTARETFTGGARVSRDITEIIDDDCREELGHSNWIIISTLSDQEKVEIETQGIIKSYQGINVLFYWDELQEVQG